MSLAEEMLATMSASDDSSTYLSEEEPHIIIDNSRTAFVPSSLKTIAVTGDHQVEKITFDCVRFWDGNDLSTFAIYLNYVLPDLSTGTYIPSSIVADNNVFHFDWDIKNNITKKSGKIAFAITAIKTKKNDSGETVVDKQWGSIPNGDCSIALGLDISNVPGEEETPAVVAQLSAILERIHGDVDEWIKTVLVQTTGNDTAKAMSQDAVTKELDKKIDKKSISQTTGSSTTEVMSQKATTEAIETTIEEKSPTFITADISKSGDIREHWYINGGNGIDSKYYFSVLNIPVVSGGFYKCYCSSTKTIRQICFYNNDVYLSSVDEVSEFTVPTNANRIDVSIRYVDAELVDEPSEKGDYFIKLNNSIDMVDTKGAKIGIDSIIGVTQSMCRRPIISFIFDGIYDWNKDMSDIIKAHGYKCGNAPQYTNINDGDNLSILKAIEADGHEILSHGVYILEGDVREEEAAQRIKESYVTLKNAGFSIKGYIASSGAFDYTYLKYVKRYFEYGATAPNKFGNDVSVHQFATSNPYKLWRYSMENSTLDQMMNAVDLAIENNGLLLFYGHAKSTNTNHFTKENLRSLLSYIDNKVANYEVTVKAPMEAVLDFYTIRYDDVMSN